jgi:hypothetical protein
MTLHCSSDNNEGEASRMKTAAKYHHTCEVVFCLGANAGFSMNGGNIILLRNCLKQQGSQAYAVLETMNMSIN